MAVRQLNFQAVGTHWNIQVCDRISDAKWAGVTQSVYQRIQSFDKAYSRFRPDSLVTHMSEGAGKHNLPPDGYRLLHFYEKLYEATNGKVTPLIGQTIADAGYDSSYSFETKSLHQPPSWETTLLYTKDSITLKKPALLDFGAAGKGYLVDIIGELLEHHELHTFTINAAGDMLHRSHQKTSLDVGLENPFDTSEAIGIAQLSNRSLCASAGSKRKWGNFNHIIDPDTLQSPQEIIATWVIADATMTADGLATALFFTDASQLMRYFSFSYAVLNKSMQLSHTKDFPVKLFQTG